MSGNAHSADVPEEGSAKSPLNSDSSVPCVANATSNGFVTNVAIATTAPSSANKTKSPGALVAAGAPALRVQHSELLVVSQDSARLQISFVAEGIDTQVPGQISQLLENAEAACETKQHERAIDYCSQVAACVRLALALALCRGVCTLRAH